MRTGLRHDRATHRTASKLGLLLLLPAVAVGCSDQSLPTASSAGPADAPALSAGGNPVVVSASGSGQLNADGGWRTFSFTAQKRANGTTTGQMQLHNRGLGVASHGAVHCLNGIGDLYIVAATGTNRLGDDPGPNLLGLPPADLPDDWGMFFVVRDNGEGGGAAADEITGVTNTTIFFATLACENPAALGLDPALAAAFLMPIEAGNIQVRD